MSTNFQVKDMNIQEKLSVMESIWNDLCESQDASLSPSWHKEVLQERMKESGQEGSFSDWDEAKKSIRNSLL